MSMARVKTTRAAKEYVCENCRNTIPKGDQVRSFFIGFRSHHRHIRCMRPACTPRPSTLESSMVSDAYAAIEQAEDDIAAATTLEDINDALHQAADGIREVAQAYAEAAEPFGGAGESQERADVLEGAADELDNASVEEPEKEQCEACEGTGEVTPDEDDDATEMCDACDGRGTVEDFTDDQIEDARQEALEILAGVEMP